MVSGNEGQGNTALWGAGQCLLVWGNAKQGGKKYPSVMSNLKY